MSLSQRAAITKAKAHAKGRQREATAGEAGALGLVAAQAREIFKAYDVDFSGSISATELSQLCFDMGFAFQDHFDKRLVLSMLDTDGDGQISFTEFFRWWKGSHRRFFDLSSTTVQSAIYYFKKYDTDMSGFLDQQEYSWMCQEMGWATADIADSVKALDKDGDGQISFDEYLDWYTGGGAIELSEAETEAAKKVALEAEEATAAKEAEKKHRVQEEEAAAAALAEKRRLEQEEERWRVGEEEATAKAKADAEAKRAQAKQAEEERAVKEEQAAAAESARLA
eukprot:COSAG04_NODE_3504_length_2763_cov_2.549550_1_plen_281_part_10